MLRLKLDPALYEWQFMDMNGNVVDQRPERLPLTIDSDFGSSGFRIN